MNINKRAATVPDNVVLNYAQRAVNHFKANPPQQPLPSGEPLSHNFQNEPGQYPYVHVQLLDRGFNISIFFYKKYSDTTPADKAIVVNGYKLF
nr:MAG TPA: hypothetical protein [Caudoviricetes sp.]